MNFLVNLNTPPPIEGIEGYMIVALNMTRGEVPISAPISLPHYLNQAQYAEAQPHSNRAAQRRDKRGDRPHPMLFHH